MCGVPPKKSAALVSQSLAVNRIIAASYGFDLGLRLKSRKPRNPGLSASQIATYVASRRIFLAKPYFDSQCRPDWQSAT